MAEKSKRMGKKDSPVRDTLIDAAEKLLYREGYANLNARRVAEEAGLKKQLLFYYFDSMDELISETHERHINAFESGLQAVFSSTNPVRALWHLQLNGNARLFTEFLAIANHSEVLRSTITDANTRTNELLIDEFTKFFERRGIDQGRISPKTVLFVLSSMTNNIIIHKELGILDGEKELSDSIEQFFEYFDETPR